MPALKDTIEIVRRKPNVAEGGRIVEVFLCGLERDQTDAIPDVKLKHLAAIVKSLITVRGPHDTFRMNHAHKIW